MPADRPLRNLAREALLDYNTYLQNESADKRYNLRKELQTDRRSNVVYANRWVTRDQFLELITAEIGYRGIELPTQADQAPEAAEPDADFQVAASDAATTPQSSDEAVLTAPLEAGSETATDDDQPISKQPVA